MIKDDLIDILEGDIQKINYINVNEIALPEITVFVKPRHVRNMLSNFLNKKINSNDLTRWAKFICMRPEYGNEYYLDDEKVDYYEDMFYVIQRLSTPEIDGEVNEKSVRYYLAELEKYSKE